MSTMAESALADMFIQSSMELDSNASSISELEKKLGELGAALSMLSNRYDELNSEILDMKKSKVIIRGKDSIAKNGKKSFNITVTGRDADERINSITIE